MEDSLALTRRSNPIGNVTTESPRGTRNVYAFGDAVWHGQPGLQSVPVTSAVQTPDGLGYWILFANGAVAVYGDAVNYGSALGFVGGVNPARTIFA